MKDIKIENCTIGAGHTPFIIAEMSGNHNQSLERAFEIIDAAAKTGAHALKIQTYTADTMTLNLKQGEFLIEDKNSLWQGKSLYELYEEAHTPWDWHKPIFERAREKGLIPFSTPFDNTAVDFLEELGNPIYKVASFENTDIPLIKRVAATGKPMIISTGMITSDELDESVQAARDAGCENLILLKCTSTYPASPENTNILTIPDLHERYQCHSGLSDHTMGLGVAVASVALGATVIEKHFTLSRAEGGVDSAFSMEPDEMEALVIETKRAAESLGSVQYGPTEKEKNSLIFRRSLYITEDLKAGDMITEHNMRAIRPGLGLPPKHHDEFIGKTVARDISKGTPVSFDIFN